MVWKVIGQKNINQTGHVTLEEFDVYMMRTKGIKETSLRR